MENAKEKKETVETPETVVKVEKVETVKTEANNFRSIRQIVADLSRPLDKKYIRKRKQGGRDIGYISWYDACAFLDEYASGWFYEIRSIQSIGGNLILIVRLSIPSSDGIVFREASGYEEEDLKGYGDASSNAESMALRRAAAKFGLARGLYDADKQGFVPSDVRAQIENKPSSFAPKDKPAASKLPLATEAQITILKDLAKIKEIPTKELCDYFGKASQNRTRTAKELTETEAAEVIGTLQVL